MLLILHTLNQHPLNDLQIVLLLIPKNSRKIPKKTRTLVKIHSATLTIVLTLFVVLAINCNCTC